MAGFHLEDDISYLFFSVSANKVKVDHVFTERVIDSENIDLVMSLKKTRLPTLVLDLIFK